MNDFYFQLFDYNYQSNEKIISAILSNQQAIPQKVLFLFSHIQNAHHIWNNRILENPISYDVFQEHAIEIIKSMNEENFHQSIHILKNKKLQDIIHYTTSKGDKFSNTIQDILFHIINHSTYHRAQIATLFRENGLTPVATDYITFKRNSK
ncbi:MAG: DinB family protein [Bacteroidota bacterium]